MTAYPELGLVAGACEGNGLLIDITDPANPSRIDEVIDPNFAYWHSATFNNDGTKVVFTDEWGGGVGAAVPADRPGQLGCQRHLRHRRRARTGRSSSSRATTRSRTSRPTTRSASPTTATSIPVPGRDIMVQAWYEGGLSVFDFTDSGEPFEIAYFDRGPYDADVFHQGGYWSAYWHNGHIYGNEIFLGFDSWRLTPTDDLSAEEIAAAEAVVYGDNNAQAQERSSPRSQPSRA